jgi:hypothetical protein
MVPGRKSDVQDCQWLQKLHSCGLLRGAFRPPENICAIRTLIHEKATLVSDRATWVHRMQKSGDQLTASSDPWYLAMWLGSWKTRCRAQGA